MSDDLWSEFSGGPSGSLCGLCGNYGVVNTHVTSPAGVACGVRRFCICPNGRALKERGADIDRWPDAFSNPTEYVKRRLAEVPELELRRAFWQAGEALPNDRHGAMVAALSDPATTYAGIAAVRAALLAAADMFVCAASRETSRSDGCGTLADAARHALVVLERYKDTQIGEVRHRLRVTLAAEEAQDTARDLCIDEKAQALLENILCTAPENAHERVPRIAAALRAEREAALSWPSDDDTTLPEDGAIDDAHPINTRRYALYAEATRLVGARRSKGGLVALVNWLLHRCEKAP